MAQEVQVKRVTRGVLIGFKKQRNRLEKIIFNDPRMKGLLPRLKRVGKCNYCLEPFHYGDLYVQVGKNKYHLQCFNIAFLDVPEDFNDEELEFINSTIPVDRGETI